MTNLHLSTVDTVSISTVTEFLGKQAAEEEQYIFRYTISIENQDAVNMQLESRSWVITDGNGEIQTVEGMGVVGQTPIIAPNQSYQYSSGCALKTPIGSMQGYYIFRTQSGEKVKVIIPIFRLAVPNVLN